MTQEEYRRRTLEKIADAKNDRDLRRIIEEANTDLEQSNFSIGAREGFFDQLIKEAQDNTATMANSGEAQKIVNEILNEDK